MNYIEAPQEFDGAGPAVFLAGGISDAENWQAQLIRLLHGVDATILNPRRTHFPPNDLAESRRQIEWEARHLQQADLVAFWFPPQSLCPIALFELGICTASKVPMVVGTDPRYARSFRSRSAIGDPPARNTDCSITEKSRRTDHCLSSAERSNPMNALLLVDIQNDFLPGGALAVRARR